MYEPFIGQLEVYPYSFAPEGWLPCDGRTLDIGEHTALFSLLGTTYGGNGQTDFALPDLRSRVAVGQGQGSGLSNRVIGEAGAAAAVSLTTAQSAQGKNAHRKKINLAFPPFL